MKHVYAFEAKSVQRFILFSEKMRDMVKASALIEFLCGTLAQPLDEKSTLLGQTLKTLDFEEPKQVNFTRRGGGAFIGIFENKEDLISFHQLWTLKVRILVPGLEFVTGIAHDNSLVQAMAKVQQLVLNDRNRLLATIPEAGPYVQRNIVTGYPSIHAKLASNNKDTITEDATLAAIRSFDEKSDTVADKIRPLDDSITRQHNLTASITYQYPKALKADDDSPDDEFTLLSKKDAQYMAMVHADGNGIGQLIRLLAKNIENIPKEAQQDSAYIELFQSFSKDIEQATINAVSFAITCLHPKEERISKDQINYKVYARPLVIAGDDLTIILQAEDALTFTQRFLEKFEQESKKTIENIKDILTQYGADISGLPEAITACAGIAYVKGNMPFSISHQLSENLVAATKKKAKAASGSTTPSSFSFHRVTTALIESYDDILKNELTSPKNIRLTLQPYGLGDFNGDEDKSLLPKLEDLESLRQLIKTDAKSEHKLGRGTIRQLLSLIQDDSHKQQQHWERWKENMQRFDQQQTTTQQDTTAKLLEELQRLIPHSDSSFPIIGKWIKEDGYQQTPLADAYTLNTVQGG